MIMTVMGLKNAAMFKWENTDFNWDVDFHDMVIIKNDIIYLFIVIQSFVIVYNLKKKYIYIYHIKLFTHKLDFKLF